FVDVRLLLRHGHPQRQPRAMLSSPPDPRLPLWMSAACFYATDIHKGSLGSGGDDSMARATDIKSELLMIWGRQDPHVPTDGRRAIQRRLDEANVNYTWHEVN